MQDETSEILSDFAFRLNMSSDRAGLSQTEIANRLGIKGPRVNNWFQGRNFPRSRERAELAKLFGVRPEWLFHGHGEPQTFSGNSVVDEAHAGHAVDVRQVPVISWTHAGEAATYEEMPRNWEGKIPAASRDPRAFALRVEGDSMEPKFFAGDLVICEPGHSPRTDKPVVAKYANEEVQLRLYRKMPNGMIRLASTRPELYPAVELDAKGFHWIFPVTGLYRPV